MNILNLYAGIGGNRKLWEGHKITAIENNEEIANIYKQYYPNDIVIVTDAHEYLREHIKEFDFIWSSPPCPTHSKLKMAAILGKFQNIVYPNMSLYQEIILLKYFAKNNIKWCVENVVPYYDSLVKPQIIIGRHYFWTNYYVGEKSFKETKKIELIQGNHIHYGFALKDVTLTTVKKRVLLRNLVNPEVGLYLLQESTKEVKPLFNFNY